MNREFLKGIGLEDEAIGKIMAEHGKTLNATKEQLDSVTTERDELKGQITERDTQLETLKEKATGNEELLNQIEQLKTDNATATTELQDKLEKQAFEFSLEKALTGAKVRNPKAIKALLDVDKIKLDGETLLNLDDQLASLKESDSYLFEEEQKDPTPTIVVGGNPQGGSNETKSLAEMSYQELSDLKANNPAQFAELTK